MAPLTATAPVTKNAALAPARTTKGAGRIHPNYSPVSLKIQGRDEAAGEPHADAAMPQQIAGMLRTLVAIEARHIARHSVATAMDEDHPPPQDSGVPPRHLSAEKILQLGLIGRVQAGEFSPLLRRDVEAEQTIDTLRRHRLDPSPDDTAA